MTAQRQQDPARPKPRLYLVTPVIGPGTDFADDVAGALAASDVAAVLLRLADDGESSLIKRVKAIAPAVQDQGAALLLDNRPDLVARSGADGAHLTGIEAFSAAAERLKAERIAGAGGLLTRHDAMLAAEGGADYVMFGEPDAEGHRPSFEQIVERVEWWADVFQTPCVAYAASKNEIAPLARAGADFVAVGDFIFADKRGLRAALNEAHAQLLSVEPVP